MFISLLISNSLFCGLAILCFIPILNSTQNLNYKNRILILILFFMLSIRLLFPFELPFTKTVGESLILPKVIELMDYRVFNIAGIKILMLVTYIIIAVILLTKATYKHIKLSHVLSIVPVTENRDVLNMVDKICKYENIKNIPKVICVDIDTVAFIFGCRKPIIVLSPKLSKEKQKMILLHEIQHLKLKHLPIKILLELIFIIYWWFPLIWLLKKEVLKMLELQADVYAVRTLSDREKNKYTEVLFSLAKNNFKHIDTTCSLLFISSLNTLEYRIKNLLKVIYGVRKRLYIAEVLCVACLSTLIMMSCLYTFEAYYYSIKLEESFMITDNSYFRINDENEYELYVNEKYQCTLSHIPKELISLEIK